MSKKFRQNNLLIYIDKNVQKSFKTLYNKKCERIIPFQYRTIQTCGKQITLPKIDKTCQITIPNHSSLIYMCTQTLNKIYQKPFKLESGNQVLTDRQASGQMEEQTLGGENIISTIIVWLGMKSTGTSSFHVGYI